MKTEVSEFEKESIRKAREEKRAEDNKKRAAFRELQKEPYGRKVNIAFTRALEFYNIITNEYKADVHVSVGGLDSLTLYLFIKKYVFSDIKGVSVSAIEDKSIRKIHKELGIISLKPLKSKVEAIKEFGFPVISKDVAGKIEKLQNPTEKNEIMRHAILTGETGKQGGYMNSPSMRLANKWQELFVKQESPFRVSPKCCHYLKEKPGDIWAKQNNSFPYLGLMVSEGGQRAVRLPINGCNYISKTTKRSCPFAIFSQQDLLRLALDLKVPVPEIYGEISKNDNGLLYTTRAQRTGCSMCGFGVHMEKRPHRFDRLREENLEEWDFWMHTVGWGEVLDYIGVGWEDIPSEQK